MAHDNNSDKGLISFLKKLVEALGLLVTLFLGFEKALKVGRGSNEGFPLILVAFAVILVFLCCIYLAHFWKPRITNAVRRGDNPSILLPDMERLNRQKALIEKEKKARKKQTRLINRIKKTSYLGTILIPLFILIDLLFWVSVRQSFFWQGLYVAEIGSRAIPQLAQICSNTKLKIKINYPDNWSCRTSENPFDQTVFVLKPQQIDSIDSEQVKIVVRSLPTSEVIGLEPFLAEYLTLLKENRFEVFELTKRHEITFIEQRGYKLEYRVKDNDKDMIYLEFLALKDLTVYIVTYIANEQNFLEYQQVAEEMITKTFDFLGE